tara:strand:+ start:286 stop:1074 length:789 start_codon:yes stop_codon:yes gene_type:complete
MKINVFIYSGLGNIIAIVESIRQDIKITAEEVKNLKEKKIDFDQLILILPPSEPVNDFDVKIFNNDASIASNCINGARCVSKFVKDKSLCISEKISIKTDGGIWNLEVLGDDTFSASFLLSEKIDQVFLNLDGTDTKLDCIKLGNPHGVLYEEKNSKIDFLKSGKYLQNHQAFPDGVNFGLARKINDSEIDLKVFERGVGETLACGSGACAAAIIGILKKEMVSPVKVNFQEGSLLIDYKQDLGVISAEGSASFIEKIEIEV